MLYSADKVAHLSLQYVLNRWLEQVSYTVQSQHYNAVTIERVLHNTPCTIIISLICAFDDKTVYSGVKRIGEYVEVGFSATT